MSTKDILELWIWTVTAVGEWLIVWVTYWELENNRVERFLTDSSDQERFGDRSNFSKIKEPDLRERRKKFMIRLDEDKDLRHACVRQLMIFNKAGSLMPFFLKGRVTEWIPHTVVFFWAMLHRYIEKRRREVGCLWGRPLARLAYGSLKLMIKHSGPEGIVLKAPDHVHGDDFRISREDLEKMRAEAKKILDCK